MEDQLIDVLTEELVTEPESLKIDGVVVGKLFSIDSKDFPRVEFPQNSSGHPIPARTIVPLNRQNIGDDITLMFEEGDSKKPIITGIIQTPGKNRVNGKHNGTLPTENPIDLKIDDEQLTFTAKKEIVLRCGKASITLTRAGKILIRGKYLLSRSSGVNRIKGGSVQVN